MLELEEALARILSAIPAPLSEVVSLNEAEGRVLTQKVLSPLDLPPFDNSSMDGYALRAADSAGASPESPVRLRLAGRVAAGQAPKAELAAGTCVRLFTGSLMPSGADAVVMQEETQVAPGNPDYVLLLASAKPWENVRFRGEDLKKGAALGEPGQTLTSRHLSLLAAAGLTQISVGRRPVVGLVATGSELREPGATLAPGQIYESNRIGLAGLVRQAGAEPRIFPLVPDELAATRLALETAFKECDAVVTCGGASVGEMDLVKSAFEVAQGELKFWKVAIKPGRPFLFGHCGGRFLFGLPGNPVSALVTFVLLVRPALLRWQGAKDVSPPAYPGVLAEPLANPGQRRHFMRVKVDATGKVFSAGTQASHILSSLAVADGLTDVPPNTTLPTGSTVRVLRLE